MKLRALLLISALLIPSFAFAGENPKADDVIAVNLSSEGWVTAKAARVIVSVNAAVVGEKASSTRDTMIKTVGDLASKTEWRLTSFNRSQDQTGIEQWYAQFEARLPESDLGGIQAKAKAASKTGMQIAIQSIDFSPTLAEFEAVRASIRKDLMAQATKELESINAAYPDRKYRISSISFGGARGGMEPQVMMMKGRMAMMEAAPAAPQMDGVTSSSGSVETSQKIEMTANIGFAALAPVTPAAK